jgi:hypothetical protein
MSALVKNLVPDSWQRYKTRSDVGLQDWIQDLKQRIDHVVRVKRDGIKDGVWMGGLAFPAGLATAFRQKAAQDQKVSIESLSLQIAFDSDSEGFVLKGKYLGSLELRLTAL